MSQCECLLCLESNHTFEFLKSSLKTYICSSDFQQSFLQTLSQPLPFLLCHHHNQEMCDQKKINCVWHACRHDLCVYVNPIDKSISLSSKIRPMRFLVTSIFLNACESWTLTAELQRRMQAMEMRYYQKILRISYKTNLPTRKSVLRSRRQLDHTKT